MSITTKHAKDTKRELPPGWKWVRLGEVCELNYGSSLVEATRQQGNIPVYGSNGIVGYHNKPITSGPTVVIGRKGSVGQIHFSPVACYPIDTTYYIQHTNLPVDLEWLSNILKVLDLSHLNKASGVPGLNRNDVTKLFIPLPPLPEQQRIAAILREQMAAVERARKAAEERLEAVKSLPAAFLRQVFPQPGQPLPPGWKWVRLGDCTVKIGSGLTPLGGQATYVSAGIPLIRSQNVHMNRFAYEGLAFITGEQDESMSESRVQPGDVLLNITGASIGRVCVVPDELTPANVNQHVSIIRSNGSLDPWFLSVFLSTPAFQKHILDTQAGATRQALTKSLIGSFQVPLPPLPEQQRIAAILRQQMAAVERARKAAEEELETINALPAALLRRAFAGEL